MVQTPNIVLNNLWVQNITRSNAMREQVVLSVNFDTSFEDINVLKQEMLAFVRDPQNSRDFHSDIEIEVTGIAEMNKLELQCDVRHKSNWSNEALRSSRKSKFMCALVLALRKIPIYAPGGGDAALGDAGKPSWSVAISPEAAIVAREKYNADKNAKRLYPTKSPSANNDADKGPSAGGEYLSQYNSEGNAVHAINNRRPGADPIRDDTWQNREENHWNTVNHDDQGTADNRSTEARPNLEEIRTLFHQQSTRGRRRQPEPRQGMPPIPIPVVPSPQVGNFGNPYVPPPQPQPQSRAPTSPNSVSTGNIEEFQYQQMIPPPRSASRPRVAPSPNNNSTSSPPSNPNNPYRSPSPDPYPYRI